MPAEGGVEKGVGGKGKGEEEGGRDEEEEEEKGRPVRKRPNSLREAVRVARERCNLREREREGGREGGRERDKGKSGVRDDHVAFP